MDDDDRYEDNRTQRMDWEAEDRAWRQSLLAERYGPLPVERTNPVRVPQPSPNLLAALEVGQEMADEPAADRDTRPWESRRAWADEMFDRIAA